MKLKNNNRCLIAVVGVIIFRLLISAYSSKIVMAQAVDKPIV